MIYVVICVGVLCLGVCGLVWRNTKKVIGKFIDRSATTANNILGIKTEIKECREYFLSLDKKLVNLEHEIVNLKADIDKLKQYVPEGAKEGAILDEVISRAEQKLNLAMVEMMSYNPYGGKEN